MSGGDIDFLIDECVVKAGIGSIVLAGRIIDAVGTGPVDGAKTHRARLAAGVNLAAGQLERIQVSAGFANGHHLGMSRRVVVDGHAVERAVEAIQSIGKEDLEESGNFCIRR